MRIRHPRLQVLLPSMSVVLLAGCAGRIMPSASASSSPPEEPQKSAPQTNSDAPATAEQGIFSAGGTVISLDGTFDVSNYIERFVLPVALG